MHWRGSFAGDKRKRCAPCETVLYQNKSYVKLNMRSASVCAGFDMAAVSRKVVRKTAIAPKSGIFSEKARYEGICVKTIF